MARLLGFLTAALLITACANAVASKAADVARAHHTATDMAIASAN